MPLVDEDIELLEDSLDGALSESEAADLRERLARDADLAAALTDARAERDLRRAIWTQFEPTDAEVDRLVDRVRTAARRKTALYFSRPVRLAASIAACLAISFGAGWKFRGKQLAGGGSQMVRPQPQASLTYQVALTDENGLVTAVQNFDSLEKAREFAQDLGRWQQRQHQMRDGAAVVVADQF